MQAKIVFLAAQSGQVRELLNDNKLADEVGKLVGQLAPEIATHSSVRQQRLTVSKADRLLRAVAGLTGVYDLAVHSAHTIAETAGQPLPAHMAGQPRVA